MGIRFTASSAAILLCSADCALSADSRAFSAAVVASLDALPAALSAVFLDNSASAALCDDSLAF